MKINFVELIWKSFRVQKRFFNKSDFNHEFSQENWYSMHHIQLHGAHIIDRLAFQKVRINRMAYTEQDCTVKGN